MTQTKSFLNKSKENSTDHTPRGTSVIVISSYRITAIPLWSFLTKPECRVWTLRPSTFREFFLLNIEPFLDLHRIPNLPGLHRECRPQELHVSHLALHCRFTILFSSDYNAIPRTFHKKSWSFLSHLLGIFC